MANTIKIKNSGTTSNVPSALEYGELAINYADGVLFYKDGSNSISEFAPSSLSDKDGDTLIQVEEGADEDIIRFDTAGVERMTIGATGAVTASGLVSAGSLAVTGQYTLPATAGDSNKVLAYVNSTTIGWQNVSVKTSSQSSVRPSNADVVIWIGSGEPSGTGTNAPQANDIWLNTGA